MKTTTLIIIGLLIAVIAILLNLRHSTTTHTSPQKITVVRPSYWLGPGGTRRWYPPRRHHRHRLGPGGTHYPRY